MSISQILNPVTRKNHANLIKCPNWILSTFLEISGRKWRERVSFMATSLSLTTFFQPKPSIVSETLASPLLFSTISTQSKILQGVSSVRKEGFFFPKASAVAGLDRVTDPVRDVKKGNPIIVIDNYDSFTYNLCQYVGELGANFEVYRNDELSVEEIKKKRPRGIIISPGPGTPQDSGISLQTVLELGPVIPLFGVCMGLQCIGEAFGGKIVRSPFGVMHGKSSPVFYDEKGEDGLFSSLPNPFSAGRYHSLVIENDSFPIDSLEITAWTEDGLIMAARHKKYRHIQGVQFHPESIMTTEAWNYGSVYPC
ncbi:anthranilate synthase beta subunit 2, chloroplastic-like isoform X2 [Tasmannia lanceolata]|uniref:anthranilate synthase beta subunit 2, chloroplastic-like isoform X2 n=1 Tax=Tasmannia lanceolata TaxID=3420 RepID=UPI004063054F